MQTKRTAQEPQSTTPSPVGMATDSRPVNAGGSSQGRLPPQYVDFFYRFNRGEYFAAHEVLEELWLQDRRGPSGDYFKGLIQIAGAFVHFEKGRPQPGRSLLKLARGNLEKYPPDYLQWSVAEGLAFIGEWLEKVIAEPTRARKILPRLREPGRGGAD
jgi:predicted metal-dependent hydrolase